MGNVTGLLGKVDADDAAGRQRDDAVPGLLWLPDNGRGEPNGGDTGDAGEALGRAEEADKQNGLPLSRDWSTRRREVYLLPGFAQTESRRECSFILYHDGDHGFGTFSSQL